MMVMHTVHGCRPSRLIAVHSTPDDASSAAGVVLREMNFYPRVMSYSIQEDDLSGPAIARLLETHAAHASATSPPESCHVLNIDELRHPSITFWTAQEDGELLGCGAIKELDSHHAEVKSMHTAQRARRRGVAACLLEHLISQARLRGYTRLSLETGSMVAFEPARKLYTRYGFIECAPFQGYVLDPHSVFMRLELS